MPPRPVLLVIGVVALIAIAGSIYVGITSENAATHPQPAVAASQHVQPPPPT
jgi:hypothetical protein